VFFATVLNHALAVAVGNLITRLDSIQAWIQVVASLSFIFFGLWTIRGDKLDGEENKVSKFGPILTVGIAFFIAEMGDKTQLATISIATKFPDSPLGILLGTTTGMMIADGIGIIIGVVLCRRIPERTVKLVSAAAFVLFGFIGSYQAARGDFGLSLGVTIAILAGLAVVTGAVAAWLIIREKNTVRETKDYCKVRNLPE